MALVPMPRLAKTNYTRRVLHLGSKSKTRKAHRANCPLGFVERKGYVRRFEKEILEKGYTVKRANGRMYRIRPEKSSVHVKPTCVKDLNPPGKTFGPIRKGGLRKHGYIFTDMAETRHEALKKAVGEFGALSVYNKFYTLAKMSLRRAPDAHQVFRHDLHWIQAHYKLKGQ